MLPSLSKPASEELQWISWCGGFVKVGQVFASCPLRRDMPKMIAGGAPKGSDKEVRPLCLNEFQVRAKSLTQQVGDRNAFKRVLSHCCHDEMGSGNQLLFAFAAHLKI